MEEKIGKAISFDNYEAYHKIANEQNKIRCLELAVSISQKSEDSKDTVDRAEAFYNFITK